MTAETRGAVRSIANIDPTQPAHLPPAPADWRIQGVLCLAVFFASLNFFAPTPFYPQIASDLQTTIPLLGQVMTLMALLSAGLGLAVGPLADRYGFRWPLVIGLIAIAATMFGTGLAPAYPVLVGVGVLGGLGDALVYSLPFALAVTYFSGEAQRRAISWNIAALSVAPIIGVPLLTGIGGATSWRTALVVAGLAALAVAWFVAVALPADSRRPTTPFQIKSLLTAYMPLLQHPSSLRLVAFSGLRGIWWIGLLTYLGAFLGTAVGLSAYHVGLVYALVGAAYALGSVAAGRHLGRLSPRASVVLSSVVAGVLVGPMLMSPTSGFVLPLLLLVSLASAISGVSVTALLAAISPAGPGTTMVLNGSILNIGAAGGAALGGVLIALGGYRALGIGLPLFAIAAAILAWWPART